MIKVYVRVAESVLKFVHLEFPSQITMGNLRFLNQKDAQNVALVKETAQQWLYSYKNKKGVGVYGTLELAQKIQETTDVAVDINLSHFLILFI